MKAVWYQRLPALAKKAVRLDGLLAEYLRVHGKFNFIKHALCPFISKRISRSIKK